MDKFASQRQKLGSELPLYSNAESTPVKSVSITLKYPIYSDLTADQLAFYNYWKSTIGTKTFKKTADGYGWLLMCELINSPDKESASRKLNALVSPSSKDGSPAYPELLDSAMMYSALFGTSPPRYYPWMDTVPQLIPYVLCSPVSDVPSGTISKLAMVEPPSEEQCRLIGTILREYDDLLIDKTGKHFRDYLMSPVKKTYLPFSEYVLLGNKMPVESIEWKFTGQSLFISIIGYIKERISNRKTDVPDVPLAESFVEIVESVIISKKTTDSVDPLTKNGTDIRMLGTPCSKLGPSCLNDPLSPDNSGSRITLGDVLTFSMPETPKTAEFITSDYEHPTYNDLSRKQFAYYNYWKNSFRNGVYLDTDNGYLNLFLTEIINSGDTQESHRLLYKLYETYGNVGLIGITITDHAICNGLELPEPGIYLDRLTVNSWIDSFVNNCNKTPMNIELLNIMRSGSAGVKYVGTELPLGPLELAIRRILSTIDIRKGISKVLSVERVAVKRSTYFGLDYLRGARDKVVQTNNYLGSRKFTTLVDKIVRYASDVNESHNKGEQGKKKPFVVSGVNCASIIYDEFLIGWVTQTRPREIKLELDRKAIDTAASDLAEVTEMMRVDELPDEKPQEEKTVQIIEKEDPWKAFFSSLDDNEHKYLELCIRGSNVLPFLKESGMTKVKIEDAINTKALDTVGDTVVEDGQAVEDYLEELEKGL